MDQDQEQQERDLITTRALHARTLKETGAFEFLLAEELAETKNLIIETSAEQHKLRSQLYFYGKAIQQLAARVDQYIEAYEDMLIREGNGELGGIY